MNHAVQQPVPNSDRASKLRWFSQASAVAGIFAGCAVMAGWALDVELLKRILPGLVAMNPATAAAFILSGASLWLLTAQRPRVQRVAQACAAAVALVGLLRVGAYITGWDLGVDQALFAHKLEGQDNAAPNRMAPNTAMNFVLLGLSLMLLGRDGVRAVRAMQFLALAIALSSLFALIGYGYGTSSFYGVGSFIPMALHTALCFMLLSLGLLGARSESGVVAVMTSNTIAGLMARRLLPAIVVIPIALGWLRLQGQRAGLFEVEFGLSLSVISTILLLIVLVWWTAGLLHRGDVKRRLAEDQMKRSEKFLSTVVENIPYMIFIKETDQLRFVLFNKAGEQLVGHARTELIGKNDYDIFLKEQADYFTAKDREVLAAGTLRDIPEEVLPAPAGERLLHTQKIPILDEQGNPQYLLGISEDITERKRDEAALRDSEERYRFLADATPQIVWTARADGGLDYYNARWYEYTGLSFEQTRDWGWKAIIHPDDLEECVARWTRSLRTGEHMEGEYRFKRGADGAFRWHLCRGFPRRNDGGEIAQWIGTCTDIHDQKEVQAVLKQAKQIAEDANRAKSEFLANMSHEIRTPLNGVIGMTDLLIGTDLTDQQCRYAQFAKSSADSLLAVLNDILDFSKIEAGKLELESINFDLRTTVEDALEMLAPKAAKKGLELACHIHPQVPSCMRGDPDRLRQILINLLNNAVKFTETGEVIGRVALESETETSVVIRFEISDTGVGIPPDRMGRLFNSFSQVDASTTRKYGGTGLGLAICKQLTEMMGGRIGVESRPGGGSTFWFTARFDKATPQAPELGCAMPHSLRGVRVLVVDDNATNRNILREQLGNWGMSVRSAIDAESALSFMRDAARKGRSPRLAILDMILPGMDGLELAQEIKADPQLKDTLLVMLTSLDAPMSSSQITKHGLAGYAVKPVRQSELLDTLMTALFSEVTSVSKHDAALSIPSQPVAQARDVRLLLAEDNEVNQVVAAEILTRVGYPHDIVSDGRQAVAAVQKQHYDLVLMDCQMPEMDGFQATAMIRQHEATAGPAAGRVPILALTANAIKGDRERCLDAGMDGYVSKPINPRQLIETIESLLNPVPAVIQIPVADADSATLLSGTLAMKPNQMETVPFALDLLLERCMNNAAVARLILDKFEKQAVNDLTRLEKSVLDGDAKQLASVAHGLKGAAGTVAADALHKIAFELEQMGRSCELAQAQECLLRLRSEVDRCISCLPQVRATLVPANSA